MMNKNLQFPRQSSGQAGQAMLIAVILFLIVSTTIVLGIATPILRQVKSSVELMYSKETYYVAEGTLEDALYRLKKNFAVATGDVVALDGNSASISITSTTAGRVVTATADVDGRIRKMEAEVVAGTGVSFNYGIQTGVGGVTFSNNSGVEGNVYSNGRITGSSGAYITGSAIAANGISETADQSNGSSGMPSNIIVFGNSSATQDMAQSFRVSEVVSVSKIQVYIKKTGTPSNIAVKIAADNAGKPSSSVVLSSGAINASNVGTSYGWIDAVFSDSIQIVPNTDYWIVFDMSSNFSSKYYTVGSNNEYILGQVKAGSMSSDVWNPTTPPGYDSYFKVYVGGMTGNIVGPISIGQNGIGDAHAHTVSNVSVEGTLYCQSGSGNNKTCNTSKLDPAPQAYPVSDANIAQWKADASAGGTTAGNISISGTTMSIGPRVIAGNLTLDNNAVLTVNGTLWVQGDISISNGSIIKLSSGYLENSGVIVSDGRISISNNAQFAGSGKPSSHILVLTTSVCPYDVSCGGANAIEVANNAGTVILNAQRGTVHFSNNSGAKEVTAYELSLDNGAKIVYDTGLANTNFSSGPSGGWNIVRWQEIQ